MSYIIINPLWERRKERRRRGEKKKTREREEGEATNEKDNKLLYDGEKRWTLEKRRKPEEIKRDKREGKGDVKRKRVEGLGKTVVRWFV